MKTFIEYKYDRDNEKRRDIRSVKNFNIQTVHIPDDAIGFHVFKATDIDHAYRVKSRRIDKYRFAEAESVLTTEELRAQGGAYNLHLEQFHHEFNGPSNDPDNLFNQVDPESGEPSPQFYATLMNLLTEPDSPGRSMLNTTTKFMEWHGCHRVIGDINYNQGVYDDETLLDPYKREIISPAYETTAEFRKKQKNRSPHPPLPFD